MESVVYSDGDGDGYKKELDPVAPLLTYTLFACLGMCRKSYSVSEWLVASVRTGPDDLTGQVLGGVTGITPLLHMSTFICLISVG